MTIVEYDANGKILSVITIPGSDQQITEIPLYQGRLFLPQGYFIDWANHYVKDDDIAQRPAMGVTFDGTKLKGAAKGSIINIDGTEYVSDGSASIDIEFEDGLSHKITVSLWPYLDREFIREDLTQG